jgi:toxin HigB-1
MPEAWTPPVHFGGGYDWFAGPELFDSVTTLEELNVPPGNRLEALKGDRGGQHSNRIDDQWRICFRGESDGVYDVEIVDYH